MAQPAPSDEGRGRPRARRAEGGRRDRRHTAPRERARSRGVRSWARVASLAVAFGVGLAGPALSESPGTHTRKRLHEDARGYAEYQQYCAVCHGVWADGQGLVKPVLTVPPTNLRTLEQRLGSPLPRERVAGYIDGRIPVLAHGSRDMPVWGKRLDEGVHSSVPDMRKRSQVMVIVDYLQAIQDAAPPEPDSKAGQKAGSKDEPKPES